MGNIAINLISRMAYSLNCYLKGYSKSFYEKELMKTKPSLLESEVLKDDPIIEDVVDFYQQIEDRGIHNLKEIVVDTSIIQRLEDYVAEQSKRSYGSLNIDYESYKLKVLMYYESERGESEIAYMAGSFFTDQEYRAFLATIQKGKKRIHFNPISSNDGRLYDLVAVKDGYLSRVKKAINANTQDGYHADFHLNNGRFFLLKGDDNPVEIIYKWVIKNTQAAVLEDWKTYIYNSLSEKGLITECTTVNYSNVKLKGLILSEKVDTDVIREIRQEGMGIGEISIPRDPVDLDPNMSFVEVMNEFIIPHLTEMETLYTVGDKLSPIIESPIIFKKGNKIKKSYLFPKQKVMAQGILNGIKEGRNNLILNGGMGVT